MDIATHHTFGEKTGKLALVAGLHVALVFGLIQGMQVFHSPTRTDGRTCRFIAAKAIKADRSAATTSATDWQAQRSGDPSVSDTR